MAAARAGAPGGRTSLLTGKDKVADIGFAAGFESESVFHRQFLSP